MFLELLPTIWLVGKTTDPTGYWEGSKIELAGAFVLRVEQVPPDGYYQCLCPQEDFQLPLASPFALLGGLSFYIGRVGFVGYSGGKDKSSLGQTRGTGSKIFFIMEFLAAFSVFCFSSSLICNISLKICINN